MRITIILNTLSETSCIHPSIVVKGERNVDEWTGSSQKERSPLLWLGSIEGWRKQPNILGLESRVAWGWRSWLSCCLPYSLPAFSSTSSSLVSSPTRAWRSCRGPRGCWSSPAILMTRSCSLDQPSSAWSGDVRCSCFACHQVNHLIFSDYYLVGNQWFTKSLICF